MIIIFAGNLETMFIGWEVLGISSFLLIAFYRDRFLPVKNALKVFSVYRIGDVGIILAMCCLIISGMKTFPSPNCTMQSWFMIISCRIPWLD
jgi:NADH:ubiquinone oxidoreductase subunit 5 (subunit L)/multisubunit Na+/H+ antiporter MnhA subunit